MAKIAPSRPKLDHAMSVKNMGVAVVGGVGGVVGGVGGMLGGGVDKFSSAVALTLEQQCRGVIGLGIIQLVISVCLVIVAASGPGDGADMSLNIISSFVALVGGCVGIHGARCVSMPEDDKPSPEHGRPELMFFVIVEVWATSCMTTFLFSAASEKAGEGFYCNENTLGFAVSTLKAAGSCDENKAAVVFQIIFALGMCANTLIGAYFGLRVSERVQDRANQVKADKLRAELLAPELADDEDGVIELAPSAAAEPAGAEPTAAQAAPAEESKDAEAAPAKEPRDPTDEEVVASALAETPGAATGNPAGNTVSL